MSKKNDAFGMLFTRSGSKGIGRFSSDRLGQIINLQTRHQSETSGPVHNITVDWNLFDKNHHDHFEKIRVTYTPQPTGFALPSEIPQLSHGTAITIERTRRTWGREKILLLKSALAKLINPFGAATDGFRIVIHAPSELEADLATQAQSEKKEIESTPNAIV